jgi:hypothetical protein
LSARAGAAYDALFVTQALSRFAGGAAAVELHLFSYLACLVSVYDRKPADGWSYEFVATPAGAPFAEVLAQETDRLRAAGHLLDAGPLLVLSEPGQAELPLLSDFTFIRERTPYLEAACAAASLLPLPTVANAVSQEPGLRHALSAEATRHLLGDAELILVDEQFGAVTEALAERSGERHDLLVPTTLWLSYLNASSRHVA